MWTIQCKHKHVQNPLCENSIIRPLGTPHADSVQSASLTQGIFWDAIFILYILMNTPEAIYKIDVILKLPYLLWRDIVHSFRIMTTGTKNQIFNTMRSDIRILTIISHINSSFDSMFILNTKMMKFQNNFWNSAYIQFKTIKKHSGCIFPKWISLTKIK